MIIFLYTDKNCEYQAFSCIQTLLPRLRENDRIVYYTIGFDSVYEFNKVKKVRLAPIPSYPTFHFYKAELSLLTMDMFPDEQHFMFTDTDVLYSRRFNPASIEHTHSYPLASMGPHEYPFIYEVIDGNRIVYDENALMRYFNVPHRTMRYVWSCIYSFNRNCRDFFEEYTSMCKNEYLIPRKKIYFPFQDETGFNVCLFKRNATQNLGYAFLNTHNPELVKKVETEVIKDQRIGMNIDSLGADWEYVYDSTQIIMYHGFKDRNKMYQTMNYLLGV